MSVHIAVDLGASSGRVMLGTAAPGVLHLEELHRFPNGPIPVNGGLVTDAVGLWQQVLVGLRAVARTNPGASTVAVDTWAVDYGLLAADGTLLGTPALPRPPDRGGRRACPGPGPRGGALPAQRSAAPAVHDDLPADRRGGRAAAGRGVRRVAAPGPLRVLAVRRPRRGGHQRLDDGPGRRRDRTLGRRPRGPRRARADAAAARARPGNRPGDPASRRARRHGTGPRDPPRGGRFARHGLGRGRRPGRGRGLRLHRVRDVGPGRRRTRAARRLGGVVRGELHQRTRRGRPDPLPAQRHGAVGPAAVRRRVVRAGPGRPGRAPRRRGGGPAGRTGDRHRRRPLPGPRADGRTGRRGGGGVRSPSPGGTRRGRALRAGEPGRRLRAHRRRRGPVVRPPRARRPPRRRGARNALLCRLTANACGLPVVAGPVEATALGNVLVQARAAGDLSGSLEALRSLVRQTADLTTYVPDRTTAGVS